MAWTRYEQSLSQRLSSDGVCSFLPTTPKRQRNGPAVAHEDAAAIQSRAAELFAARGDAVMAERHRVAAARHVRLAEIVHWRIAKHERHRA
jgi:hypothetical protein